MKTSSKMEAPTNNKVIVKDDSNTETIDEVEYNQQMTLLKRIVKEKDGLYRINGKTYKKLNGTREEVWNETAYRTEGLLVKNDLIINKDGKIVSKRKHICSKERNNLQSVNDEKIKNAKG